MGAVGITDTGVPSRSELMEDRRNKALATLTRTIDVEDPEPDQIDLRLVTGGPKHSVERVFRPTKIVDRTTGEVYFGRVPAYSVVVPGSLPGKELPDGTPGPSLYCAVIVKRVDEGTRAKTSINELLRD